ncbi:MAG: ATP-dependent zinc metalloprotease FtsH [Verrucomicrobiota bacterium]
MSTDKNQQPDQQNQSPKYPKAPDQEPSGSNGEKRSPQQPNWRGLLFFSAAILMVISFLYLNKKGTSGSRTLTMQQFYDYLEKGKIEEITLVNEPHNKITYLTGTFSYKSTTNITSEVADSGSKKFKVYFDPVFWGEELREKLKTNGFPVVNQKPDQNQFWQAFFGVLPFILFIVLIYFLFRQQLKMAGKSAFSFGKSKAKMLNKDKNKITFSDVAGVDEAKEEVTEIVDYLKDPKKFQRLGGRIPKGVLMVGPPGTGKTLLAKAIAGEADVPFYGISGSDFVEMFVGVGASRVRDMFEQGRKSAPCLIFIDEIDAVGRSRGQGLGGGHDEREQTLNALLVEMDGIDSQEGVIIIAATNRKDVLDPALLRPGRFDREVVVNLPDVKGREQILGVHAKKVKLNEEVKMGAIARGTPGFSGAELANLINEAALLAARRDAENIVQADLEEARDKVRWGRERRSMAMTEEEKKNTAYHEAGHALLNVLLKNTDPLHKVSIIPRGPALGVTMSLPEKDHLSYYKLKLLDLMCMIMGGRVAEELFLGDVCSGASGDIQQATSIARRMVCDWGMSENLGMVKYGQDEDHIFLGRDLGRNRSYSEATAQSIDEEVLGLVNEAYNIAKRTLQRNKRKLKLIAEALLEYETLDGSHIEEIVKYGKIKNPPPKNVTPPTAPLPQETLDEAKQEDKEKDEDGLLADGDLGGAPAGA